MRLYFKGKNGQVSIENDGRIWIGRSGWFGVLYQALRRTPTEFHASKVEEVILKEPGLMRGYLSFKTAGGLSTVWLTNEAMAVEARRAKKLVDTLCGRQAEAQE